MLRKILVLVALFSCVAAHAEAPEVELHLGARGQSVHLVWAPKNWPAGLHGYALKRRAEDEVSWTVIGKFRPTAEFMRRIQAPGASFAEIRAPLLSNFAHAHVENFAHIDRFPVGMTGEMEYAVFAVVRGIETPRPSARVIWNGRDTVDLDVGVLPDKTGWDGKEAYFGLDIDKFLGKVTRYYIAEVRGKESRHVNGGRQTHLAPFEWSFVCHRPSEPLPEAIRLIAESRFGFQKEFDIPIPGARTRAPAGAAARTCDPGPRSTPVAINKPTAMPGPPPPQPAPPPAPPAPVVGVDTDRVLREATLWLDATRGVESDGDRVAAWRDQSASRNDATMAELVRRPHLVEEDAESPALSFRGAQSFSLARAVVHDEMTVFIVGHRRGTDDHYGPILGAEGGDKRNDISWIGSVGVAVVGPKFAEPDTRASFGNTRQTHVLTMRADGEQVALWRNGRHVRTATARRAKGKRTTGFSFNSIGSVYSSTYLDGELYAILVIPRMLSDAEIEAVDAALTERYPVLP